MVDEKSELIRRKERKQFMNPLERKYRDLLEYLAMERHQLTALLLLSSVLGPPIICEVIFPGEHSLYAGFLLFITMGLLGGTAIFGLILHEKRTKLLCPHCKKSAMEEEFLSLYWDGEGKYVKEKR